MPESNSQVRGWFAVGAEENAVLGRMLEREQPSDQNTKAALLALARRRGEGADAAKGGYGYCTLYTNSFRQNFSTGTGIAYDIVCPTVPGGKGS